MRYMSSSEHMNLGTTTSTQAAFWFSRRRSPTTGSHSCGYSCGCGYQCSTTCYSYISTLAHFQDGIAFATAHLNDNNRPDVIAISAKFDGSIDGYARCPWSYRFHVSWRIVVIRDFGIDGTISASHVRQGDGFFASISDWQASQSGNFPTALRVEPSSSSCGGSHPHLAILFVRRVRLAICFNINAGSLSETRRFIILNKDKSWTLRADDSSSTIFSGSLGTPATDSYMAVGAYDFNNDGSDDLWLLECPSVSVRVFRHGIIADSWIDSEGRDGSYVNEYL
ncbi:hypothetical protein GEMRC1_008692 [Eukaryota sp. GEM-RC1]